MRHFAILVTLLLPLPPAHAQNAGPPPGLRQAVVASRVRLDATLATRDTTALAGLFAEDVALVRGGDTLRGRAAVAAFVARGIAGLLEARLNYAPAAMVLCTSMRSPRGNDLLQLA